MQIDPKDAKHGDQQRPADGTHATLLLSAALVQMSAVVHQLRCGLPIRRGVLRVMLFLDCLSRCDELAPELQREFADLTDAWTGLLDRTVSVAPSRSAALFIAATQPCASSTPARGQLRLVSGHPAPA